MLHLNDINHYQPKKFFNEPKNIYLLAYHSINLYFNLLDR